MRTAIVGDIHLMESNYHYGARLFSGLASHREEWGVDRAVFLGDMYNQRSLIRASYQRVLVRGVAKMIKAGYKSVDIVVGNHDYDSLDNMDLHSLEVLEWLLGGNVHIYNHTAIIPPYLYLPYQTDFDKVQKCLDDNRDKIKYVYCHLPISGFLLTPFHKESHGITPGAFSRYAKVFAGHFHIPQEERNIIYPGSVFVNTYAEAGVSPHILIHDEDTNVIQHVNTKTLIPDLPLYFVIKIDETLKALDDIIYWENSHLKFIINAKDTEDCRRIHKEIIDKIGKLKCHLQFQYKVEAARIERMPEHLSLEAMFLKYVKEECNDDALVRSKGLDYIKEFYAIV